MHNSEKTTQSCDCTTQEEKRLLEQFRRLTPEQRRKVLAVARRLAESEGERR